MYFGLLLKCWIGTDPGKYLFFSYSHIVVCYNCSQKCWHPILNQIFAVCDCDLASGYFRKARFYCIYLREIDLSNSNNFCRRSFLYQQEWIVIKLYAIAGSFEESVLNGRLEPVSTVHGFTADLGASGSFCPAHLVLPVTVFFYTLGDNDKVSSPYLVSALIILIFG